MFPRFRASSRSGESRGIDKESEKEAERSLGESGSSRLVEIQSRATQFDADSHDDQDQDDDQNSNERFQDAKKSLKVGDQSLHHASFIIDPYSTRVDQQQQQQQYPKRHLSQSEKSRWFNQGDTGSRSTANQANYAAASSSSSFSPPAPPPPPPPPPPTTLYSQRGHLSQSPGCYSMSPTPQREFRWASSSRESLPTRAGAAGGRRQSTLVEFDLDYKLRGGSSGGSLANTSTNSASTSLLASSASPLTPNILITTGRQSLLTRSESPAIAVRAARSGSGAAAAASMTTASVGKKGLKVHELLSSPAASKIPSSSTSSSLRVQRPQQERQATASSNWNSSHSNTNLDENFWASSSLHDDDDHHHDKTTRTNLGSKSNSKSKIQYKKNNNNYNNNNNNKHDNNITLRDREQAIRAHSDFESDPAASLDIRDSSFENARNSRNVVVQNASSDFVSHDDSLTLRTHVNPREREQIQIIRPPPPPPEPLIKANVSSKNNLQTSSHFTAKQVAPKSHLGNHSRRNYTTTGKESQLDAASQLQQLQSAKQRKTSNKSKQKQSTITSSDDSLDAPQPRDIDTQQRQLTTSKRFAPLATRSDADIAAGLAQQRSNFDRNRSKIGDYLSLKSREGTAFKRGDTLQSKQKRSARAWKSVAELGATEPATSVAIQASSHGNKNTTRSQSISDSQNHSKKYHHDSSSELSSGNNKRDSLNIIKQDISGITQDRVDSLESSSSTISSSKSTVSNRSANSFSSFDLSSRNINLDKEEGQEDFGDDDSLKRDFLALGQRSHSSISSLSRRNPFNNLLLSSSSSTTTNNNKRPSWTSSLLSARTRRGRNNNSYRDKSFIFNKYQQLNYKRRARSLINSLSQSSIFALYTNRYAREKLILALRLFRNWYHEQLTYHKLSRRMEYNELQFDHWLKRKGSPLQLRALDKFDQIVIWIADERDAIQTKTFSKWINKYLSRRGQQIHDLFNDLRDGQNLITLLEMLSGQQLPREKGRMRVHNLQNIQIALNYIRFRKVKLVNIRPEDIVDGNQKLTLGLIWTIILHFQLEDNSNFREILLRWAQKTCDGYPGTNVTDLTKSWRDGLAFNAILHRNRPDLLDYRACRKKTSRENLDQAFSVADRELGVARLLDPEDVDVPNPDEKSMITYLAQLYELFPDPPERNPLLDAEMARRIEEYKDLASRLVKWVKESTTKLDDRHFPRTIPELKKLRDDTERFRCEEVPPKQHDKQRLAKVAPEILDMAADLNVRIDPELLMPNIERLWDRMMGALKDRARAIDDELAKAERLAALLQKLLADIKKTNERMDKIENDLNEEERRVGRIQTLKEAEAYSPEKFQKLGEELAEVGIKIDSIKRLADDFIKEAGRSHPDSIMVREKVAELDGRYKRLLAKLANIHDQYERTVKRLRELEGMRRDQLRKEAEAKLRLKLDAMKRELDELERRIDNMGPVSKDLATLQRQLAELHEFDQDLNRSRKNLNDLIKLAEGMIRDDLIADPPTLRAELQALKDQLARIEDKAARRLREFEDALARAEQQKAAEEQMNMKLDALKKLLDELERRLDSMAPVAKDLPTLTKQLAEMQQFQQELARAGRDLQDVAALAEDLIGRDLIGDPHALRASIKLLKDQFARIEDKAARRLRAIEDGMRHAEAQKNAEQQLALRLDSLKKELEELERRLDAMAPVAKDLQTLRKQLAELQDFEHDLNKAKRNMGEISKLADDLIRQELISDPNKLRNELRNCKEQLARIEDKFARRMKAILDGLKRAEAQDAAEKKYRLRLDEMKRELDELERRLNAMAPIAKDLGPLQEQLKEIEEFLQKLALTKKSLADLLKTGDELIRDDLIAEPATLKADMKGLRDQFDRIEEAALKRLRDIRDAMSRVAASDAIQEVAQWLERAKRVLVDEENVHGDLDTVTALIEQHKAFQGEVLARQPAITEVRRREAELSSSSPANGAQLREELAALSNQWREMEKLTREKSQKLEEALRAAEQLHHSVHALLEWLAEAEQKLRFAGALPEDEQATRVEIGEHDKLLRKLASQEQTMNQALKLAQEILSKCHPDAEPVIKHWQNIIQSRWDEIDAWAKQRTECLANHLRALEEILQLVEELVNWLARNETRLLAEEAEPLPDNAQQLDSLIDQHSNFMDELRKREPQVDRVVKIFASKNAPTTSKVHLTTSTTSASSKARDSSVTRSGRLSAGSLGSRSTTPTRTSYATYRDEYPEIKHARAKCMLEKWRQVWQLSLDKMQKLKDRTEHLKEIERLENFDFDEWRRRFVTWVTAKKGRVIDFFRSIDDDNDGRIPIEAFVSGVLRSRFESSRLEMERVAEIIDKNHDGSIDNREFLDSLRPDKPITDDELIQDEVQRQVSKCTCSQRYKVYHVGDGRYRFGESQKLRLVRILRSTVMVRVGGGWEPLATFLQKNDPCRVKGRTNVELREQFILPEGASQAMAAFKTRLAKSPGSMSNLGPITKIREKTDRSMPMGPQTTGSAATTSRHGSPSDYYSETSEHSHSQHPHPHHPSSQLPRSTRHAQTQFNHQHHLAPTSTHLATSTSNLSTAAGSSTSSLSGMNMSGGQQQHHQRNLRPGSSNSSRPPSRSASGDLRAEPSDFSYRAHHEHQHHHHNR